MMQNGMGLMGGLAQSPWAHNPFAQPGGQSPWVAGTNRPVFNAPGGQTFGMPGGMFHPQPYGGMPMQMPWAHGTAMPSSAPGAAPMTPPAAPPQGMPPPSPQPPPAANAPPMGAPPVTGSVMAQGAPAPQPAMAPAPAPNTGTLLTPRAAGVSMPTATVSPWAAGTNMWRQQTANAQPANNLANMLQRMPTAS